MHPKWKCIVFQDTLFTFIFIQHKSVLAFIFFWRLQSRIHPRTFVFYRKCQYAATWLCICKSNELFCCSFLRACWSAFLIWSLLKTIIDMKHANYHSLHQARSHGGIPWQFTPNFVVLNQIVLWPEKIYFICWRKTQTKQKSTPYKLVPHETSKPGHGSGLHSTSYKNLKKDRFEFNR